MWSRLRGGISLGLAILIEQLMHISSLPGVVYGQLGGLLDQIGPKVVKLISSKAYMIMSIIKLHFTLIMVVVWWRPHPVPL